MFTDTHCGEAHRHVRSILGQSVTDRIAANRRLLASWSDSQTTYAPGAYSEFLQSLADDQERVRAVAYLRH